MPHAHDCAKHTGHACDCGSEACARVRVLTAAEIAALPKGAHFMDANGRDTIKLAERATAWAA